MAHLTYVVADKFNYLENSNECWGGLRQNPEAEVPIVLSNWDFRRLGPYGFTVMHE
jgi:hypothetical protein